MEVLLVVFFFVSTSVLGLLCLVVLEYQNSRARRWNRLWLERRPKSRHHSTPPHPGNTPAPKLREPTLTP